MKLSSKIYIAGHTGLVGSALWRRLESGGYTRLIGCRRAELELTRQTEVEAFFERERPEFVFLAAAKVGGILANNTYPADFIYSNLIIQTNIIHSAFKTGVKRLLFLGSSCIYPRDCPQPMQEDALLTGTLEPTNEPYALAKIAGIKMCQSYNRQYGTRYFSVMPTNLYGPNDNFDLETSHVLPALIRKFHLAKLASQGDWKGIERDEKRFGPIPESLQKEFVCHPTSVVCPLVLWGTGKPRREFMHVDDLSDACVFIMSLDEDAYGRLLEEKSPLVNIGWGRDISIFELAWMIKRIVGYEGELKFDDSKPDGTPRKLLDVSRLQRLGWTPRIGLEEGISMTYRWFMSL
jgi:GDP-L-fucose synthase